MSSIGPVATALAATPTPKAARDPAGAASLAADQNAATKAHTAAKKTAATLVTDQKAKAADQVIRVDQQAVTAANAIAVKADARVKADQGGGSARLNVTT
jgi:hypothetical protein